MKRSGTRDSNHTVALCFNTVFQDNTPKTNVMYWNIIDDMTQAAFYKVTNHLSFGVASKHQVEKR